MSKTAILALYEAVRTVFFRPPVSVDPERILAMEKNTLLMYATALRNVDPDIDEQLLPYVGVHRDSTAYSPVFYSINDPDGDNSARSYISIAQGVPGSWVIEVDCQGNLDNVRLLENVVSIANREKGTAVRDAVGLGVLLDATPKEDTVRKQALRYLMNKL